MGRPVPAYSHAPVFSEGLGCAAMASDELELELARSQCEALHSRLAASASLHRRSALPSLLRLVAAELRFLSSAASGVCSNVPHLSALHLLLTHPSVLSSSRLGPRPHADFACAFRGRPAWALVSARNPARLAWAPRAGDRGLRARVAAALAAARAAPAAARPEKLLLVLARGARADVARGLADEFAAAEVDLLEDLIVESEDTGEEDWVDVSFHPRMEEMRSYRAFEIDVVEGATDVLPPQEMMAANGNTEGVDSGLALEGGFGAFMAKMSMDSREMVNLDTTALVAIVSGTSNGGAGWLMGAPEAETRARFKGNYKFVIEQALSELQSPIFLALEKAVNGKRCIICEGVKSEFKEIVSMCGGPDEQTRANQLLKLLVIVPDCPSARMMDLPTTRKLAMKNKIVFGTGDQWRTPTLTANMGFVRAVSQSGMSLLTMEHRPCALIGL